jgi:hypothetical protein
MPVLPPEKHPLRILGKRLADLLDDDHFNNAEQLLLAAFARERDMKHLYIRLTNQEQYGEDGEVAGHYCPNELLREFDAIFAEDDE